MSATTGVRKRIARAFALSPAALHQIEARVVSASPVGASTAGAPLALQLVRPVPTRIAVVGATSIATGLCLRAAAFGADVVVVTERGAPWEVLSTKVGGEEPCFRILPADAPPVVTGLDGPLFVAFDHVRGGGESHLSRGPWHTSMHVVAQVDPAMQTLFDAVDLVIIGRLAEADAALAVDVLRLPPSSAGAVTSLREAEAVMVTRRTARLARVHLTEAERQLLGVP